MNALPRRSHPRSAATAPLFTLLLMVAAPAAVQSQQSADGDRSGLQPSGTAALARATSALLGELPGTQVGLLAVELSTGRVLTEHQSSARFVPASNQKILVTASALSIRGPEWRFVTELRVPGATNHGGSSRESVAGDLIVCGSGDPTWSRRFAEASPGDGTPSPLDHLAAQVGASGVRSVPGRLIVDASQWDSLRVPDSWMAGDLAWGYAATGGVVSVDEGSVEVIVDGRVGGHHAEVTTVPERWTGRVTDHVDVVAASDSARIRAQPLSGGRWSIQGRIRRGVVDTLSLAVPDPIADAGRALARALADHAIPVMGGVLVDWTGDAAGRACSEGQVVASTRSAPLIDIVGAILKPSQNWIAEQVVRSLAEEREPFAPRGSRSGGLARMKSELADVFGVDTARVDLRDGSGLSAYNLVTPRALVRVLREAAGMEWGAAYRASLAEPGEVDSTLDDRLGGLGGRLFAKTGTITHVNSLSGYLVRDDGSEVVFSVLTNVSGRSSREVRRAIDRWVRALAEG